MDVFPGAYPTQSLPRSKKGVKPKPRPQRASSTSHTSQGTPRPAAGSTQHALRKVHGALQLLSVAQLRRQFRGLGVFAAFA